MTAPGIHLATGHDPRLRSQRIILMNRCKVRDQEELRATNYDHTFIFDLYQLG